MVHMLTLASYPLRNLAITRDFATYLGSTGKGAAVRCAMALGERPNWGTKAFGLIIGWAAGGSPSRRSSSWPMSPRSLHLHSALFGLDDLAENPVIKVSLGIVFIAIMTYISCRRHRDH